jgi:hypothetical protein
LQIRDSSRKGREVQRRRASCRKFKKFRKFRKIREVWEVREIRANRSKRSGISIWMIRKVIFFYEVLFDDQLESAKQKTSSKNLSNVYNSKL